VCDLFERLRLVEETNKDMEQKLAAAGVTGVAAKGSPGVVANVSPGGAAEVR
jgi:hypothetical protein